MAIREEEEEEEEECSWLTILLYCLDTLMPIIQFRQHSIFD